jgi:hypothetical protein
MKGMVVRPISTPESMARLRVAVKWAGRDAVLIVQRLDFVQ